MNHDEQSQKLKSIKGLEERIEAIDYERKVNPDFKLPDDYHSCRRLAESLRTSIAKATPAADDDKPKEGYDWCQRCGENAWCLERHQCERCGFTD